jgi:tetratricopeptide (TPR) repeat protein
MKNFLLQKENKLFWGKLAIIIITFVLYSNTIGHDYALDDAIVITNNHFTQQGFDGINDIFSNDSFAGFNKDSKSILSGGRYRPLSIATFAFENGIWGNKPHHSHLLNIILYALTGLVLFKVMRILFKTGNHLLFSIPFVATLIFLTHPVHTEVVANIKGRDEILSLLFSLIALLSALFFADKKKWYWLVVIFLSMFAGLLSKENAVSFVVLIPLSIFFFRKEEVSTLIKSSIPAFAAVALYFIVRHLVIGNFEINNSGGLMNNPFQDASFNQKYSTIFLTLGIYLKLLFWPHPLTYDYYPFHIPLVSFSNGWVILSLLVYIVIFVYAIVKSTSRNTVAYSIFFFLIALFPVSNLLVGVGVFMSERFIYQASLGFSLAMAYLIISAQRMKQFKTFFEKPLLKIALVTIVLLVFSSLTYSRNFAWKNNYTLFLTDIETSQNSAKGNYAAGKILLDSAYVSNDQQKRHEQLAKSIQYLSRAIEIDPGYTDVWINLGTAQFEYDRDVTKAFQYYLNGIKCTPKNEMLYKNIHFILSTDDNPNIKIELYNKLLAIKPDRADVYTQLGFIYGKEKKENETAIRQFKKSIALNPSYIDAYKGLGTVYLVSKNPVEALACFKEYLKYNANDASIYRLMAAAAKMAGDNSSAEHYLSKAKQNTRVNSNN